MKKKIKYTEGPMDEFRVIEDFLPPPEQLILKEDNVKITISLNKRSVDFFKQEAQKNRTSYQRMIRRLLEWYASNYRKTA
jgi:predicted DNA binding CopG/RHH family protein